MDSPHGDPAGAPHKPLNKLNKKKKRPSESVNATAASVVEETGQLSGVAIKRLMKVMWVARYCRDDVLRAVSSLATRVTKWTPLDDKKLTRMISYLHHATHFIKIGFISDPLSEVRLVLFLDATLQATART